MKVSLNTVKQFTGVDLTLDELVEKINTQLGAIEEIVDLNTKYKDAVIAKVVKCDKHPNADKLSVCEIDAGTGENVQVVCGAPNVREGLFVVWLPPESTVPATFDDSEPFVLTPKELRGVVSHGMLASPKELGIGDSHDGILEITDYDIHQGQALVPGAKFAELFGLDDTVIDIENKMFTHRPDLFGQLGVAREIAGIQHKQFTNPDWYTASPEFKDVAGLELDVFNEAGDNVPRFMAVAVQGVEVKPSPLWLQCALVAMGSKPINNVVDATNYIMLLTAQPTHAYDYDKLRGHKLGARMAKKAEKATLLNGREYELDENDIVIVDGEGVVGLGGIMGGGNSEVSSETKNIVLEVANFDMYAVRRSSMRHGLFTDALTRFNKGQSPLQNPVVLNHLMNTIERLAGGQQASHVFDDAIRKDNPAVEVTPQFINERLGLALSGDEMKTLLQNVEFGASEGMTVTPPFWRTDIALAEDIVEEIGRLYGYHELPRELPLRSAKPTPKNETRVLKSSLRERLSMAGANEVLTYSFVHQRLMEKTGQDPEHAYRLSNALSPDLQYYRLSLTPSLLDKVHMNLRAGIDEFALFEIGKSHFKGEMDPNEPDVPNEDNHLALVVAYGDKQKPDGAAYFQAKRLLGQVMNETRQSLVPLDEFDLTSDEWGAQLVAPYDPARSAVVVKDKRIWGVVGEFKTAVKRALKLPEFAAGFEVHLDLLDLPELAYVPLSKYPSTTRDISLEVADEVTYDSVLNSVRAGFDTSMEQDVRVTISPVSVYQGDDTSKKTITLQAKLTPTADTLSSERANDLVDSAVSQAVSALGARVI